MTMITFAVGADARFNYRVVSVVMSRGRVLLHRTDYEDFWSLPGGRAELMETSAEGVRREMIEELGVEISVTRLLWVVEAFFDYDGKAWHELGLYYLVNLPTDSPLHSLEEPFYGVEQHPGAAPIRLIFAWFPVEELESMRLFPHFLRTGLRQLPDAITHVVNYDRDI